MAYAPKNYFNERILKTKNGSDSLSFGEPARQPERFILAGMTRSDGGRGEVKQTLKTNLKNKMADAL